MENDSMRAAIYCRVSKSDEEKQHIENQLNPLIKYAEAMSLDIVSNYTDRASGGDSNRPEFQKMLSDARIRKFDVILIWALDRFSREGILQTLSYLKTLKKSGVALRSLQEPWLDTSDEGMGELLISLFSWVAEQERIKLSERIKAGLKGKKNVGKRGKDKKPRRKGGYYRRWERIPKKRSRKNTP